MQMMHRRLEWHLRWPHPGFVRREVALAQITGRTRRDHVVPGGMPATRSRQYMIEGEVVTVAAILAGEAVARENVKSCECRMSRWLHEGLERDDARQLHLEGWAVHRAVVIGDDVYAF